MTAPTPGRIRLEGRSVGLMTRPLHCQPVEDCVTPASNSEARKRAESSDPVAQLREITGHLGAAGVVDLAARLDAIADQVEAES